MSVKVYVEEIWAYTIDAETEADDAAEELADSVEELMKRGVFSRLWFGLTHRLYEALPRFRTLAKKARDG